jgi:hypothetical protein
MYNTRMIVSNMIKPNSTQIALLRNLLMILAVLGLFFVCLLMIVKIQNTIINNNKPVLIDQSENQYIKLETKEDLYPELKISPKIVEIPKVETKNSNLLDSEMKVGYLGVINNFENYKVLECSKDMPNCNTSLIIKLNKTGYPNLVINKNYTLKATISKNFEISFIELKED